MEADVLAVAIGGGIALVAAMVFLVLWLLARAARRRTAFDRSAAERRRLDLELSLAEQTSRLRMVRELHELVVHSTSVIVGQADGARYAAATDPAAAARSAGVIADTARATLADLRRIMALAREGEIVAGPPPSLASLRDLFKTFREAGLEVEFRETGERLELPTGAQLALYRIVDEALENALAHGGAGTTATVTFRWTGTGVELIVDDDGIQATARRDGTAADGSEAAHEIDLAALTEAPIGRGMTEMRERAELYGGMLTARSVPGVGFTVTAVFPGLRDHNGITGVRLGTE